MTRIALLIAALAACGGTKPEPVQPEPKTWDPDSIPEPHVGSSKPVVAPRSPKVGTGWWCAELTNDVETSSTCNRTAAGCEENKALFLEETGAVGGDCVAQQRAACVTYRNVLEDGERTTCAATVKHCKQFVSFVRINEPDDYKFTTECGAAE